MAAAKAPIAATHDSASPREDAAIEDGGAVRQWAAMGKAVSLAEVRQLLAGFVPGRMDEVPEASKAAVAAVLREGEDGVELLFIHRAEHPRDPWSGHVSFPGGRVDPADGGLLAAAIRETREELGVDLDRVAERIGSLSEVRTHLKGSASPRSVVPFVFALRGEMTVAPNAEVQQVLWVPLAFLLDRDNRSTFVWLRRGIPLPMPSCRFQGHVIWGLTLRFVDELLSILS